MDRAYDHAELENQVFETIRSSGWFTQVQKEVGRDGALIDIIANAVMPSGKTTTLVFEIEIRKVVDLDVIRRLGAIKERLCASFPDLRMVLVVIGDLTARATEAARGLEIEVIPFDQIAERLPELASASSQSLLTAIEPRAAKFLDLIDKVPLGTPGWMEYQKLCADIFEYLYCPPLDVPLLENPDASRRNRRDMIFPNNVQDGFWSNLRSTYSAHYIVVDAKNYSRPLQKKPVLDIAHYLKSYGCGLFGILFSRRGPSYATIHAIQQEWISGGKMILGLSDNDLREMIRLKQAGNFPEEWLKRKVCEFRTAL